MIDLATVWAVATAELRLTRRLKRYWWFIAGSYLLGVGSYVYYSFLHGAFSSYSGTIGMIGPRFLFAVIGLYYLFGFVIAFVFLGFDVRARDQREGIHEVLDARPLTNLELVAGRFVGLFLAAWIPILILTVLLEGAGLLLTALGAPIGDTLQPLSMLTFAVFMSVPALAFGIALVYFVTLLVGNRLLAATLSIAVLYGMFGLMATVPSAVAVFLDYLGMTQMGFGTDIVPQVAGQPSGWLQRSGYLVAAIGLLCLGAAVHRRLDGSRRALTAALGAAVLAVGLGMLWSVVAMRQAEVRALDSWLAAHRARLADPVPDITGLRGTVELSPGEAIEVALEMSVRAPDHASLATLLFTLNPGLVLQTLTAADGSTLRAEHRDGLLEVFLPRPLPAGERTAIRLEYRGVPDAVFGYLDTSFAIEKSSVFNSNVALLGYVRGIFDRRFVALMPGLRWLPHAGPDIARDDTRTRPRDYFDLDLTVEVPEDWTPAAPGRRLPASGADPDRARYRFAPAAPVPEVALIAARFTRVAAGIQGVEFELLLHPSHARNLEYFADAAPAITAWIGDKLAALREAGLAYPFDAMSAVEVPYPLRSYEGGWRMNTALAQPGLLLVREPGFPTARFGSRLFRGNAAAAATEPDAERKRDELLGFFGYDFTGGNIFVGAARSFFGHQTAATGPEAVALDFMLEELATLVIAGQRGYFSAHVLDASMNATIQRVIQEYQTRRPSSKTIADVVIETLGARPAVWDHVLEASLLELDPAADPRKSIDILTLKAGAMARLLYDELGVAGSARLLGRLAREHRGGSYTLDDVVAAIDPAAIEEPARLLADWLGTTRLPGFVAESVEFYRLPDDELDNPQYQFLIRIRNDEPVPGTLRVSVVESTRPDNSIGGGSEMRVVPGEVIRVGGRSAIEYGVVLSRIPVSVWVEPSTSLNREAFLVYTDYNRDKLYDQPRAAVAPIRGSHPIEWNPRQGDSVVVDDLDPGFSVLDAPQAGGMRLGQRNAAAEITDQGLPAAAGEQVSPNRWSRVAEGSTWGRYRHTMAYMKPGTGESRARFAAQLPQAGTWQLEIHLPNLVLNDRIGTWGTWQLQVGTPGSMQAVEFDTRRGFHGWNRVGDFNVAAGEVTVLLSDASDGTLVIADAIRWTPRNPAAANAGPEDPER